MLFLLCRILPDGQQIQYVMGPTGPMILIPSSNGIGMPTLASFQWLPPQQVQQQQPQPMEITVTTVASNNSATMTTMTPKTQPMFIAVTSTAQQQQQQQQTTIDSFNEKHRDVEEHFKRSLALLHSSSSASSLPLPKDSIQAHVNTVTVTHAISTPNQPTLFMPTIPSTQIANTTTALQQQQQQVTLENSGAAIYAAQQKQNVTEVSGRVANAEVAMSTPMKSQNVINNALNIENLIANTTTSNTVTVQPTPVASSQQTAYETSGHEQQQTKGADIQVASNPFPAIFLAPGGIYPQAAAAAAAAPTGLNYAPFIMDPNLLGTMLVSSSQLAAQANQAALLQQGGIKLTNEDLIKMVQAQASSSVVSTPAAVATTENSTDASNAVMTMLLQRGGVKPVYVVNNSDGTQQLRSISGSNIIAMATTMDNGSSSNTLSTQNSSSQIVPTPMNTDEGGGQVMETNQPAVMQKQQRSVHSDASSVSEQVEDHFTRALGNNWQLTQKY